MYNVLFYASIYIYIFAWKFGTIGKLNVTLVHSCCRGFNYIADIILMKKN